MLAVIKAKGDPVKYESVRLFFFGWELHFSTQMILWFQLYTNTLSS